MVEVARHLVTTLLVALLLALSAKCVAVAATACTIVAIRKPWCISVGKKTVANSLTAGLISSGLTVEALRRWRGDVCLPGWRFTCVQSHQLDVGVTILAVVALGAGWHAHRMSRRIERVSGLLDLPVRYVPRIRGYQLVDASDVSSAIVMEATARWKS